MAANRPCGPSWGRQPSCVGPSWGPPTVLWAILGPPAVLWAILGPLANQGLTPPRLPVCLITVSKWGVSMQRPRMIESKDLLDW